MTSTILYDTHGAWRVDGLTSSQALQYWVARCYYDGSTTINHPQCTTIAPTTITVTSLLQYFWTHGIYQQSLHHATRDTVLAWCIISQLDHPAALPGLKALLGIHDNTDALPACVLPHVSRIDNVYRCYYHLYLLEDRQALRDKCALQLVTLFNDTDTFHGYLQGIYSDDPSPPDHAECHSDNEWYRHDGVYTIGTIHGWLTIHHPIDVAMLQQAWGD